MIEVIRVARAISGSGAGAGQLPEPTAVRLLQVAAFEAEGLPRLIADLLTCYTQEPVAGGAEGGARYRFLDHDVRLVTIVGRAAGLRSGPDGQWAVSCIGQLAEYADRAESGAAAAGNTGWPGCGGPAAERELLRRLGRDHLVCGRLNPEELRQAPTRLPPAGMLGPAAVGVLAAISRDAVAGDPSWTESADLLTGLGLTPGRARQVLTAVGPLIVSAAGRLEVFPHAGMPDEAGPSSVVGDSAGVILAICDLIAISSLRAAS